MSVWLCVFHLRARLRCCRSLTDHLSITVHMSCLCGEAHIWAPPSSCLSTSPQSHSPPSPCQSPCQYPIRTQRQQRPSSSATTPAEPWSPRPPLSPPPSQTHASCRHSNRLCRGTPCRQGYHSDLRAQVRDEVKHSWSSLVKKQFLCSMFDHLWHFLINKRPDTLSCWLIQPVYSSFIHLNATVMR